MPFPAGGTTDVVARLVAQRFSESMKQPVVVDNRGGAGEALAVQRRAGRLLVKRAEGDVPPSDEAVHSRDPGDEARLAGS